MSNAFRDHAGGLTSPFSHLEAVTPGTDLAVVSRGLYVGGAGDVAVTPISGAAVVLKNVPAGSLLPIRAVRVEATGTTAIDIVAGA